ncbi:MAG: sensor histidine kinase KdpD [Melioribacteraceae bacterium]
MENSELNRPNPDALLNKIIQKEEKVAKGKLKIFFGMCAGVGKTYSMLQAAQRAKIDGIDIVVGIVETHNRIETEELLDGLEIIPLKQITYRGSIFKELSIDEVLKRKPTLVLIDELAHTNIHGSRHLKRYQDVLELLNNGIDVFTTLNVQHIESRSEIVKKITGTTIRETVPDSILDETFEIELVDITPDELLQRLTDGKIYTAERSRQAIENFFRKGNLTALREMSLRITAERVDKDLRDYKNDKNIFDIWKSGQRIMCAISASPYSADLIRWTRRLAYSLEAPWIAVYVETDKKISEDNKNILLQNFKLVKELGGEIITTQDVNLISALVRVAKENNISQIIIGKTRKPKFLRLITFTDFISQLIKASGDIDINVVGGDKNDDSNTLNKFKFHSSPSKYFWATIIIGFISLLFYYLQNIIGYQIVSLFYLLLIIILPIFSFGFGPILLAALLSALSWNFFFIPPHFTFHIEKAEDVFMFVLFFIVASVSGFLSTKVRTQQELLRNKEKRISILYNLSKRLSSALNINEIAEIIVEEMNNILLANVVVIFAESENKLNAKPHSASSLTIDDNEWGFAQWAFTANQITGKFTSTLPGAMATYYPISCKSGTLGVIGIHYKNNQPISFDLEELLNDIIVQISKTIEREYLDELSKKSLLVTESEKLYKTLFNSISHELKTPISTIIGAVSSLNDSKIFENKNNLIGIINEINIAAERLHRLVENLLDMARLESGNIKLKYSWNSVSDLIYSAINRLKGELISHNIIIKLKDDYIFQFDFALLEQAIINIIHNSILYTPAGSEIKIEGFLQNDNYILNISDNGSGFSEEALTRLFNKFYRIPGTKVGGTGLGLSIAKGFIEAHDGTISASNKINGGAIFTIILSIKTKVEIND